jgi:hypothetical protein
MAILCPFEFEPNSLAVANYMLLNSIDESLTQMYNFITTDITATLVYCITNKMS